MAPFNRYAHFSVFQVGHLGLLIDLLYLVYESTFGHYGSFYHFMLAWITLFYPPLYIGMPMLKGTRKYVGVLSLRGG